MPLPFAALGVPERDRARADELLEVEGVAAAVAVQGRDLARTARGVPDERRRLGLAERGEPQPDDVGARERGEEALRRLPGPVGEGEQHRPVEPAAQQRADQLQRGVVAPVQVVEHEHEPVLRGERLQQRLDRPVGAIAVVGHGGAVPGRVHGRQEVRELGVEVGAEPQLARADVGVQRIDPHAVGEVALELRGGAREDEMALRLGQLAQLAQEARLADARVAGHGQARQAILREGAERLPELLELGLPADQR